LALNLAEMEIAWNPMFQSGRFGMGVDFDRVGTCQVAERMAVEHDAIEVKCCGYYPQVHTI